MTTVMNSSANTQRSKSTRTAPPPRPPPPRKAFSVRDSKTSKGPAVVPEKKRTSWSEHISTSGPPPKPPRSYTAMSGLRQKSATLPSSLREARGADLTGILRRYGSSDGDRVSLPSASGEQPMDGECCTLQSAAATWIRLYGT